MKGKRILVVDDEGPIRDLLRDAITEARLAFFGDHRPPHSGLVIAGLGSPEVRVEVENRQGLLKPGMLVEGTVDVLLDADGEPVIDTAGAVPPRVIPASAPLLTGERAVVYDAQLRGCRAAR